MKFQVYTFLYFFMSATGALAQTNKTKFWEVPLQYLANNDTVLYKVVQNLSYKRDTGGFTTLDIYIPTSKLNKPAPVVFLVHGGPLNTQVPVNPKDWAVYQDYGKLLAMNGFAAITFNHRYWDKQHLLQSRADIIDCIKYLRSNGFNYSIDTSLIGMWFFSAGSRHYDYFVSQRDTSLKALISFYGVFSDAAAQQPVSAVYPKELIVRCGKDNNEILELTDAYVTAILKQERNVTLINYSAGVHAFDIFQKSDETTRVINKAIDFLKEHLWLKTE